MKKLCILLLILVTSCNNTDEQILEPHGMLEGLFLEDSEIVIEPINELNSDYLHKATKRGFYFKPHVDIEITAVGGRMATAGNYEIEIIESYSDWGLLHETEPIVLSKKLNVTNESVFQYVELENNLLLKANQQYVLKYFSENHESVFDVILPNHYQNSTPQSYLHPQMITNIQIGMMYYSYYNEVDGEFEFDTFEGKLNAGAYIDDTLFLRGIPDFKYRMK